MFEALLSFFLIKDTTFSHQLCFIKVLPKDNNGCGELVHAICKLTKASICLLLLDAVGCPCVSCLCVAIPKHCSLLKVGVHHLELRV